MATLEGNLEILKAQAEWIEDNFATDPQQCKMVLEDQIDNITLMIEAERNDTINPTLTPPPN